MFLHLSYLVEEPVLTHHAWHRCLAEAGGGRIHGQESLVQHFFQRARALLVSHKIDQNSGLWRRGARFSQAWLNSAQVSRVCAVTPTQNSGQRDVGRANNKES